MKKTWVCSMAVVLAVGLLSGCGQKTDSAPSESPADSEQAASPQEEVQEEAAEETSAEAEKEAYHFIYVTPAGANAYWVDVQDGIDAAAKDLGVTVETVGPDDVDQIKQIEAMEAAAVDKPDGIMTMALNPESFTDPVKKIVEGGVPVVLLDGDAPESQRSFYVGVNTFNQGVDMVKKIASVAGEDAKIGIVTAGLDVDIINQRIDGMREEMKNYEGMEIVAVEDAHGDTIVAGEKATAMIQTYPEINVMVAAGASDVPGVGKAIEDLGKKDEILGVAFNDDPQGLSYLETGVYDFIIASLPFEEGYATVQAMLAVVKGEAESMPTDKIYLRSIEINAENTKTYKDSNPPSFDELVQAAVE